MDDKVQRMYTIGDHWIYYKVYCGVFIANEILINVVKPLVDGFKEDKIISKWFFIRYNDPEAHLRLRFLINDTKYFWVVIEKIKSRLSAYLENKEIWDIQLHTYKRELERYGENTIEISESIFFYDSEKIIMALKSEQNQENYFLFVIKNINSILTYFKFDDNEKLAFVTEMRIAFKKEFNIDKAIAKQLDLKYRNIKQQFSETLYSNDNLNKDKSFKKIIDMLLDHKLNNTLLVDTDELVASYIHMSINRSFKTRQRLYELLVYDMLYKFYKTKIAIS